MSRDALHGHFEDLHANQADPWNVTTDWYEVRKRQISLAMLPRASYRAAFEPGCSVGAVTELLATRCDRVLAADTSAAAVRTCRERTATMPNVAVAQLSLPEEWPAGRFDLVVLSEVGYYLSAAELADVLDLAVAGLDPDGTILAVHWRRVADDFVLPGGDDVHRRIRSHPGLSVAASYEDDDFLADVLRCSSGP